MMTEQETLNAVGFHDHYPMMNNNWKHEKLKKIESKITSLKKQAEAKKAEAEDKKDCFLAWQAADQQYCFALQQIDKLEKELELVRAGWGL